MAERGQRLMDTEAGKAEARSAEVYEGLPTGGNLRDTITTVATLTEPAIHPTTDSNASLEEANDTEDSASPRPDPHTGSKQRGRTPKIELLKKQRSNSLGSISEYLLKRKRDPEETPRPIDQPSANNPTKKGPLANPAGANISNKTKEDECTSVQQLATQLAAWRKENREERDTLVKAISEIKLTTINSLELLRTEINQRDNKWEKNIESLEKRLSTLENQVSDKEPPVAALEFERRLKSIEDRFTSITNNPSSTTSATNSNLEKALERLELQERSYKRNNIIIKGLVTQPENINMDVEKFLREELKVPSCVIRARYIGIQKKVILAEIVNWEAKMEIMRMKKQIGTKEIYIENDLTKKEREIAKKLRDEAKDHRKNGSIVRIGFQKIEIDGKWFSWDQAQNRLIQMENRQNKQKKYDATAKNGKPKN